VSGNDPRGINVAFAARKSLVEDKKVQVKSHAESSFSDLDCYHEALKALRIEPHHKVFNRDCLEVSLDLGETELTLYLCHFKAVTATGRTAGREGTLALRQAEAEAVRNVIVARFGEGWREANWAILGDLNDFRERILPGAAVEPALPSSFDRLAEDFAINPVDALPPAERWTYFHRRAADDGAEVREEHVQLDYVLLSPALAAANPSPKVEIVRRGLPYRVPLDPAAPDRSLPYLATRADRYPRVGWDRPAASDHCPVVVEIEVPARAASPSGRGGRSPHAPPLRHPRRVHGPRACRQPARRGARRGGARRGRHASHRAGVQPLRDRVRARAGRGPAPGAVAHLYARPRAALRRPSDRRDGGAARPP
jgi:hypothetical protein